MEKYCSQCGTELVLKPADHRLRPTCPNCRHVSYGHSSLGVGGLLMYDGKVTLIQRGQNPGRGIWTIPSGYVEVDETLEAAIVREFIEETGLQTRPVGIFTLRDRLGSDHHNLYCVFELELVGPVAELRAEGDGDEIMAAGCFDLATIASMEHVSSYTRWCIQHFQAGKIGLARAWIDPHTLRMGLADHVYETPSSG